MNTSNLKSLFSEIADLPDFYGCPVESVHSRAMTGDTPLHAVVHWGNDAVLTLLRAGADPNAKGELNKTPLHIAAGTGDIQVCRTLLDYGASPDLVDDFGFKPLKKLSEAQRVQLAALGSDGRKTTD
jgi:uncharacterized protein